MGKEENRGATRQGAVAVFGVPKYGNFGIISFENLFTREDTLIDRKSRDALSEKLRQYVSGRITNDALESLDINRGDAGVHAVEMAAWYLYDDLFVHKATGDFYISKEHKHEISRWILFLQTDEEFLWTRPHLSPFIAGLHLFTFGLFGRKIKKENGDMDVWPFFERVNYNEALQNPKYLVGL